jgi:isopentenyl-diphosphate delta-isomerase
MGYQSLKHLLHLPLAAVDFGAAGGTNFALLENLRRKNINEDYWAPLVKVGHDAEEMMGWVNAIVEEKKGKLPCQQIIISGGVKDFLDGYYLMQKSALPSIYGQASGLLNAALEGDTALHTFLEAQIRGLEMAHAFLKVK